MNKDNYNAYIRSHVMAILSDYNGRGINHENLSSLATDLTDSVIEAHVRFAVESHRNLRPCHHNQILSQENDK